MVDKEVSIEARLQAIEEKLDEVLHNQAVIYGRMLVTRKNMQEILMGEIPSMTENEAVELAGERLPKLVKSDSVQKRKFHS